MRKEMVIAAGLVLALAGCGREVPFTVLDGGSSGGCLLRRTQMVVRTQFEWEQFWATFTACPGKQPAVDFSRQMAIVYATGMRGGGFSLTLDRIGEDREGNLVVHLTTRAPRAGCMGPANIIYPRVVALTAQRSVRVRFETRHKSLRC
ncbi:MAG TPA: protease complex subunit PrcB family protein [Longimicrobium sp.]|nr:protease complex subunit PrcB family protein [Longimicrobium sp.]